MDRLDYVKSIENVFLGLLNKAVVGYLFAQLPFLNIWPLNGITKALVEKVIGEAAKQGEIAVFFAYADFRVNKHGKEFSEAALEYYKNKNPQTEAAAIEAFKKFAPFSSL